MLIRDRRHLLNGNRPAGIQAEFVSPPDDFRNGQLALTLVHIENGDTQEPFVGGRFSIGKRKPECRHDSRSLRRSGPFIKRDAARARLWAPVMLSDPMT